MAYPAQAESTGRASYWRGLSGVAKNLTSLGALSMRRDLIFFPERWQVSARLALNSPQAKDYKGLGLFDFCSVRGGGAGRARVCGQTLNKPPGTKPRNAAKQFG